MCRVSRARAACSPRAVRRRRVQSGPTLLCKYLTSFSRDTRESSLVVNFPATSVEAPLMGIHFHTKSRIRDRGFVLLRHVQLALLPEPRASVPLAQGLSCAACGEEDLVRGTGAHGCPASREWQQLAPQYSAEKLDPYGQLN